MYWIQSATDFLITITPPLAEPDLVPTVSDSRNIKDAVSLTYDNDAGVWLARIRRVQANIQVLVKALDPSGNEAVASSAAPLIWAAIGKLHVVCKDIALSVANPPVIQVYTLTGTLLVAAPAQEGETVIPLSQGIYIVKVGGKVNKVVVK